MLNHLKQHFGSHRTGGHGGLDIARHIGPGLLVTVGFIDPGNWASNMAAGSQFGYALLWIVIVWILGLALAVFLIGFVIWIVGFVVLGIWVCYRIVYGWMRLSDGRPMPM